MVSFYFLMLQYSTRTHRVHSYFAPPVPSGGPVPQVGVTITMDDVAMNGTNRVVLDGVITSKECDTLLQLATVQPLSCHVSIGSPCLDHFIWNRLIHSLFWSCFSVLPKAAASAGDGYRGRRSPHTPHEKFEGLTVLKAAKVG